VQNLGGAEGQKRGKRRLGALRTSRSYGRHLADDYAEVR
jgi:hypothetical protein